MNKLFHVTTIKSLLLLSFLVLLPDTPILARQKAPVTKDHVKGSVLDLFEENKQLKKTNEQLKQKLDRAQEAAENGIFIVNQTKRAWQLHAKNAPPNKRVTVGPHQNKTWKTKFPADEKTGHPLLTMRAMPMRTTNEKKAKSTGIEPIRFQLEAHAKKHERSNMRLIIDHLEARNQWIVLVLPHPK